MRNGRRSASLGASRFTVPGLGFRFQPRVERFRYRHILVSTSLKSEDRAAVLLGFELAALHQCALTLVQASPRSEERMPDGLDAISLLHTAAEDLRRTSTPSAPGESERLRVHEFLGDTVPAGLLEEVSWRMECRAGSVTESVLASIKESAADLVILSVKPFWRWLPVVPWAVRSIERRTRANVIVVRGGDKPSLI